MAVRMPFGKFRGYDLDELPVNYLQWLANLDDLREPLASAVYDELDSRAMFQQPPAQRQPQAPEPDILKMVHRRLALKHHPDKGGNSRIMAGVNLCFDELRKALS